MKVPFVVIDYDDVPLETIYSELMAVFPNLPYEMYESSPNHYIVKINTEMDINEAILKLEATSCDKKYIDLVQAKQAFYRRLAPKIEVTAEGMTIKPLKRIR